MTADLPALIDAMTIPVGLIGLYFWVKFCIATLKAKLDGYEAEGGVNQIKAKAQGEG